MSGDYTTALFNVLGTMAALLRRDADGQGQVVDTAMFEAALRLTGDLLPARTALGIRRERAGGDWPLFPAGATVEAGDGRFVAVSGASAGEVEAALGRLGRLGQRGDDPAAADYWRRAQLVLTALDAENELADNDRWFLDCVNEKISAT